MASMKKGSNPPGSHRCFKKHGKADNANAKYKAQWDRTERNKDNRVRRQAARFNDFAGLKRRGVKL